MMKYLVCAFLFLFSCLASAERPLTAPEKFKLTLKPSALKTIEQFESLMSQEYYNHLSRLSIVRLQDLLKIRRAIIDDGAVFSQQKIDEVIFFELNIIMRSGGISQDQISFIQDLKSELATYPLSLSENASEKLKALYKQHKI